MGPLGEGRAPNRRLDSWKEIATFFRRDERTVKRWEKERGLPVHRLQDGTRGPVYAFTDELAQWMNSPVSAEPVISILDSPDANDVSSLIAPRWLAQEFSSQRVRAPDCSAALRTESLRHQHQEDGWSEL